MIANPSTPVPTRRRPNALVRLFSSIRFGVILLALIFIYSSIVSAVAPVRWALEMTEMQAFRHWLFVTLVVLFCLSLMTATWTRIRWNWLNAGVLTVHTGLLLLTGGAVWYFGTKVEGDVKLEAPRIELIGINSQGRWQGLAEIAPEKGQVWETRMPAFGGNVRVSVLDAKGDSAGPAREATVRVEVGGGAAQTVPLTANGALQRIGERLAVRLRAFAPVTRFYVEDAPALYYRKAGATEQNAAAIHGLPLYKERYLDEGYTLRDGLGREMPSNRAKPEITWRGGAKEYYIPTGWFERWRLPIPLVAPGLPFDVEVTGYVPYVSFDDAGQPHEESVLAGDGPRENPAVQLGLAAGGQSNTALLFAAEPNQSLVNWVAPVEFRWVSDEKQYEQVLASLAGPHELSIEVLDPPVKKTVAITEGQTIAVEGTPYKLTVKTLSANWPLMSPGFQGAVTPAASIDVTNGQKSYNRTVIQRFPQLSQDIDEKGVRRREGPYDPNLILRYRSCPQGWVTVVAGPKLPPVLGIFDGNGSVQKLPIEIGRAQPIKIRDTEATITLQELHPNARASVVPVVEAKEARRPDWGLWAVSAIRLKLTGKGEYAGWTDSRWCYHSMYPSPDSAGPPIRVRPQRTDGKPADEWELTYSRSSRDLGTAVSLQKYGVKWFPGQQSVDTYRSDILVRDNPNETPVAATVQTNEIYTVGPWALFQKGEDSEQHWRFTILGVGTRYGIWPMALGCILIPVGCLYAFYVKPVLRRRMKQKALAEAQARGVPRSSSEKTAQAEMDMAEVQ